MFEYDIENLIFSKLQPKSFTLGLRGHTKSFRLRVEMALVSITNFLFCDINKHVTE